MLRKLLKHEFRATARVMGPLCLILLVTAIGGNVSIRIMDGSPNRLLNIFAVLFIMAFVVAVIGVCIMSMVVMIQRFYKNLMGDEGYVMFTLPVSIHQQIWSKLIVSSVWFITTGVALTIAVCIMVFDVAFVGDFLRWLSEILNEITAFYAVNGAAIFLEFLVLIFVSCATMCLQFYASMAVGHSFANHKGLLSVAVFFGFQFAFQLVGSLGIMLLNDSPLHFALLDFSGMAAVHLGMGLTILGMVIYGAIFYVITTFTLKKHLNLE